MFVVVTVPGFLLAGVAVVQIFHDTGMDRHAPAVLAGLALLFIARTVVVIRRIFFGKRGPTNISRLSSDELAKARSKLLQNRNRSSV